METAPGGPSATTAQIETALLDALHTIRTHWAALLAPGGTSSIAGGNVGRSNDEVTALDRKVSLSHEVTDALHTWSECIVRERGVAPLVRCQHGATIMLRWPHVGPTRPLCVAGRPYVKGGLHNIEGRNVDDLCDFIRVHARWFSGHSEGQQATDELTEWAGRVESAAAPKGREWIYIGDCPFIVEDWFCAGQVRYPRTSEEDDPHAFCSDCGQIGVASWWEEVITGRRLEEVPRSEIPALIYRTFGRHVSRPTLHRWIKLGAFGERVDYVRTEEHFDRAKVIDAVSLRWIAC